VLIWQSQLTANDFPPVCAMTGAPAETWRRFSFATAPGWSYLGGILVAAALSRRASGYLPFSRAAVRKLRLMTWAIVGLIPLAIALWIAGGYVASISPNNPVWSAISDVLFLLGLASIVISMIGLVIGRRGLGPKAKILDPQPGHYQSLIELRNVHPAFVVAVQQHQHARAAQYAYAPQAPFLPESK
jgi:hypothetical protein